MSQIRALTTDILIVGSGAAGMSAAVAASASGASVIVADDRKVPGGVLTQCVHSGFGLGRYGKEMTGPEYSKEEFRRFAESSAIYLSDCRVLSLSSDKTALVSGSEGLSRISFRECILATGCTERPLWRMPDRQAKRTLAVTSSGCLRKISTIFSPKYLPLTCLPIISVVKG